ncbi:MAG: Na(+)-translocating NADH-quinone reductase subunit C [Pseudomonadota bacterium]
MPDTEAAASDSGSNKDSLSRIMLVALSVCLVCSIVVSTAAVALKPAQEANKALDRKQNILRAAGLLAADASVGAGGESIDELFASFRQVAIDLETGQLIEGFDTAGYDPLKAAKDPGRSLDLTPEQDIATIGRREDVGLAYLLEGADGTLDKVVIPVRGYGLWGTLYGFLALEGDLNTIAGLGFYEQKETPGLGGEVDNPAWKALWPGVKLYDGSGKPSVALVKGRSPEGSPAADYEVDALSGATFTTKGVQNLVNFWTGELAYGPYLKQLSNNRRG